MATLFAEHRITANYHPTPRRR